MSLQLAIWIVVVAALVAGVVIFERMRPQPKLIALVASLAALAVALRILFAPLPDVKPTDVVVIASGYVFGSGAGMVVGGLTAAVSNLFFGQGPWTPWQMLAWGLMGIAGYGLAAATGRRAGRLAFACVAAALGFAFGFVMDIQWWATYAGTTSFESLTLIWVAGLPSDIAHAVANFAFAYVLAPAMIRTLERYRRRFYVTWRSAAESEEPVAGEGSRAGSSASASPS